MDSVELISLAVGGGVILLAIVAVFVIPALGGDHVRGNHRDSSVGVSADSASGDAGGGD